MVMVTCIPPPPTDLSKLSFASEWAFWDLSVKALADVGDQAKVRPCLQCNWTCLCRYIIFVDLTSDIIVPRLFLASKVQRRHWKESSWQLAAGSLWQFQSPRRRERRETRSTQLQPSAKMLFKTNFVLSVTFRILLMSLLFIKWINVVTSLGITFQLN